MTGSHSRLGISDWESRTTGVIRAYDIGLKYTPRRRAAIYIFWAQFSRELARLYEYSYRPCAVCLLLNFVLGCNRRLGREVSRERKQVSTGAYERREAARRSVKLPYIVCPILCRISRPEFWLKTRLIR